MLLVTVTVANVWLRSIVGRFALLGTQDYCAKPLKSLEI